MASTVRTGPTVHRGHPGRVTRGSTATGVVATRFRQTRQWHEFRSLTLPAGDYKVLAIAELVGRDGIDRDGAFTAGCGVRVDGSIVEERGGVSHDVNLILDSKLEFSIPAVAAILTDGASLDLVCRTDRSGVEVNYRSLLVTQVGGLN